MAIAQNQKNGIRYIESRAQQHTIQAAPELLAANASTGFAS